MHIENIPLDQIYEPTDPHRLDFDVEAMNQLETSIRMFGLINPITLSPNGDKYDIVAGHRRYLAHVRLGHTTIAATVRKNSSTLNNQGIRFAENFDRSDLTPMEEAIAIAKEHFANGTTVETIAKITHRSEGWVCERIKLSTLNDELARHVHARRITIAAALALARVEEPQHQAHLLRYTIDAGATIAVVRQWVQEWEDARDRGEAANAPLPPPHLDGQPITMIMPCYACHQPHEVYAMRIIRVCTECDEIVKHLEVVDRSHVTAVAKA